MARKNWKIGRSSEKAEVFSQTELPALKAEPLRILVPPFLPFVSVCWSSRGSKPAPVWSLHLPEPRDSNFCPQSWFQFQERRK